MRRDKAVKCIVDTLLFAYHRIYILWEDGTEVTVECEMENRCFIWMAALRIQQPIELLDKYGQ